MGEWARAARLPSEQPVVVLLIGLSLMLLTWLATTPSGTAADETDHYVKALAAGRGDLRGHPPGHDVTEPVIAILKARGQDDPQLRAVRWIAEGARTFTLPVGLVPRGIGCFNNLFQRADPATPANCQIDPTPGAGERRFISYEAVNPPYMYLLSGAAMRLAGDHHVSEAYRLGRAGMGLICLVLLALALLLLWDPRAGLLSLVGLLVATTPMSVWSFSVLNPSGLEIAGALCWAAVFLRLLRDSPPPRWTWAAAAASGVTLATARSSGPLFIVLIPLCLAILFGFRPLLSGIGRLGRGVIPAAVCVALGLAAAFFWLRYIPDNPLGTRVFDYVGDALSGMPRTLRESVGRFAGDYFVPVEVAVAWGLLALALLAAAAVVATSAQRLRLALVTFVVIVATIAYAAAFLTNGFLEFYGRYALPALCVLPLGAGWILSERRSALSAAAVKWLGIGLVLGTALLQLGAWWLEARRLAVGTDGSFLFFGDVSWDPPVGWLPWALVMLLATAAYASAIVGANGDRSRH